MVGWNRGFRWWMGCAAVALLLNSPGSGQEISPPGALGEVHIAGQGDRTLLLIPCMSCRWRAFDSFVERNSDRYRLIAVTMPGFGGSPVPNLPLNSGDPLWQENAVRALSALIDEHELQDVVVVAHSWGGQMALQLADARPDAVGALVFLDSWPMSERSWFADDPADRRRQAGEIVQENTVTYSDLDAWQAFNRVGGYVHPERQIQYHGWFMATPLHVVLQYWQENALIDLNPVLRRVTIPILDVKAISPGVADPEKAAQQRHAAWQENGPLSDLKTVFLYGTGHHVLEQRPAVLDSLIAAFLRGEEVRDFRPAPPGTDE